MTNLMQVGAEWLGARLKESAGRAIAYRRGQLVDVLTATCAMHEYELIEDEGFVTSVKSYDWTITTADLALRGEAITPRPGDRIIELINGVEVEYEAMSIGKKPASESLDSSGVLTLVHTKRIR